MSSFPKGVETGHVNMLSGSLLTGEVIQMPQPLHLRAAFGELCLESESIGERTVDVVFCLRLTHAAQSPVAWRSKTDRAPPPPISLRSSVVAQGSTISARRAAGVHQGS